jgi:dihydroorotase
MKRQYDLILKGGRVIDPASGLDGVRDLAVSGGKIAEIAAEIPRDAAAETVDVRGRLVLPGLIDTHAHVYEYVSGRFGLNADMVGIQSGVTTVIDQGGPSCMTFPGFRKFIVEQAQTNVLAFLSAYVVGGLEGHYYPSLYGPDGVDVKATIQVAEANRDIVKGIKAHAEIGGYLRWGNAVMKQAKEISRATKLPLYIHLGQLWPLPDDPRHDYDADAIIGDIVELLDAGDVLAHPFTRHPGGFVDASGHLHPIVREALAKGVLIDVGHGSHFSFTMARKVLEAGIIPFTLGADMHGYNTKVPKPAGSPDQHPDEEMHLFAGDTRFSLTRAMSELLALGLTLEEVVPMVSSHCATMLKMDGALGTLAKGALADVSVIADECGRWLLADNEGTQVTAERMLTPLFCLRGGKRFDAVAPILPHLAAA